VTGLASLFTLDCVDEDRFRSAAAPDASTRLSLYGGVVMGQALRAAGSTVAPDRLPHSLHGYFLTPGRVDRPILFEVDRDRDGRSFSARHVRALQDDKVILSMVASFAGPEAVVRYDGVPVSHVPAPEELPGRASPMLVEMREVTPTRVADGEIRHTDRLWVRPMGALSDDPLEHACAVAYVSDLGFGFGQTEIPGVGVDGPSLGHSLWFHAPIRADDWMLLDLRPVSVGEARGIYHGSIRSRAGVLAATLAQEVLLRDRPLPPGVLDRMAEYLGVTPAPED